MIQELASIRDIIIPLNQYPHIREDEPIGDGVERLLEYGSTDNGSVNYDELFVINEDLILVGRLTIRDILTSFFPSVLSPGNHKIFSGKKPNLTDLSILVEDGFVKECRRQAAHTVGEYMTAPHKPIALSLHPLHALEIMVKDDNNTLPVSVDNVLQGAVRMNDIFRVLASYCSL